MDETSGIKQNLGQKPESKIPHDVLITGDEIVSLLSSPRFHSTINSIVGKLRKTDLDTELGFDVMRDIHSPHISYIHYESPRIGGVGMGEKGIERFNNFLKKGKFPFVSVHTHPSEVADKMVAYGPSGADLHGRRNGRLTYRHYLGYDLASIEIIVVDGGKGNVEMIVYQEPSAYLNSTSLIEQYGVDMSTNVTKQDALDLLKNYGYKAAIIGFTEGEFSPEDIDKLKSFEFKLTPLKRLKNSDVTVQ